LLILLLLLLLLNIVLLLKLLLHLLLCKRADMNVWSVASVSIHYIASWNLFIRGTLTRTLHRALLRSRNQRIVRIGIGVGLIRWCIATDGSIWKMCAMSICIDYILCIMMTCISRGAFSISLCWWDLVCLIMIYLLLHLYINPKPLSLDQIIKLRNIKQRE